MMNLGMGDTGLMAKIQQMMGQQGTGPSPGLTQGRGFQMPSLPTPHAGPVSALHAAPQQGGGLAALLQNPQFLGLLGQMGQPQGPPVPPPAMMASGGNPQFMPPPAQFTRPGGPRMSLLGAY